MKFEGSAGEYLDIVEVTSNENCYLLKERIESALTLLWFQNNDSIIEIDGVEHNFQNNEMVFYTEFHRVVPKSVSGVRMVRFNRSFYCIADHDSEVSCKGLLFFGANQLPIISLDEESVDKLQLLYKMFLLEMKSEDRLQLEMLQMMLKRLLILCTRIYKASNLDKLSEESKIDLVREFNFLVEQHFRELHEVSDYADLLHKSPKTLSNLFAKFAEKTPLQYIQDRRLLEAKRLLRYSDKTVQEIAYEIGFKDLQTFSRFFKKKETVSPSEFKENI